MERPAALHVPGDFVQAEFMVKDAQKHSATGGWGCARSAGKKQKPYAKDANFPRNASAGISR